VTSKNLGDAAKAVVRRNTEEVQGGGNFELFDELFADDFLDHTPQPGRTLIRAARDYSIKPCGALFPTFMPRSIGSSPMATA